MTPGARQLLTLMASKKQGRVSFKLVERDRAMLFAEELIAAGLVKERRFEFDQGLQITEAGWVYVRGAA